MHHVLQDIQQIRTICQQLSQRERQNAQMLASQSGFPDLAQRETMAAQQLQQCIQICNHMEQEIQQQQMMNAPMQQNYTLQHTNTMGMGAINQQGYPPNIQQAMQADRQLQEYNQTGSYGAQYAQMSHNHMMQTPGIAHAMQADQNLNQGPSQQNYNTPYNYRQQ